MTQSLLRTFPACTTIFCMAMAITSPSQGADCSRTLAKADARPCVLSAGDRSSAAITPDDLRFRLREDGFVDAPWTAEDAIAVPFAVPVEVRNSASISPGAAPTPKPLPRSRLDVWSKLDKSGEAYDATQAARGGVGADYKVGRSASVGLAMEADEKAEQRDLIQQESQTLNARLAYRPSPLLNLDASAKLERSNGALAGRSFESSQSTLLARLKSDLQVGKIKVTPSVTIRHGVEGATGGSAAAATVERDTVVVEPRISRPVQLDGGRTLEPFLTYKKEIDIGASGLDMRSAGAGVTLDKSDAYSLSLSTNIDDLDAAQRNVTSQLRVKVPLR